MERLWAPWRMEYIMCGETEGCIFCIGSNDAADREILVVHRSASSFVMLNRYPYTNGHLMVIPYRHTATLDELDAPELLDLMECVRLAGQVQRRLLAPNGYNIGMNLGKVAGAGVADHLHFHVVPRWNGDANFMSVVAETRVVPEALITTFDRMKPIFLDMLEAGSSA